MYTAEYNGYCTGGSANRKNLKKQIDTGVKAATGLGLYVIIDWHILSDGNPNTTSFVPFTESLPCSETGVAAETRNGTAKKNMHMQNTVTICFLKHIRSLQKNLHGRQRSGLLRCRSISNFFNLFTFFTRSFSIVSPT